MISPARLEAYMRRAAALQYETVELPPFALFFHPDDPLRYFNYARPVEPVGGDLAGSLGALRAAFAARDRLPRFEFVAEFAPALAPALAAAGFLEEARQLLLVCTAETFHPAPEVPGLEIAQLTADAPIADLQAFATVQRRGFEGDAATPATEADGERVRRGLADGTGAFLARLDGQPAGAGVFTAALDGLTELAGIATLEAYRRRGIATALTARAVQAAFGRGVEVAFLVAADARAGRVYQRIGFRPYATALAYYAG